MSKSNDNGFLQSIMKEKIIILALLVGFVFFLPHIIIPTLLALNGGVYYPLVASGPYAFDEMGYSTGVRDVLDGHFIVSDTQVFEHKGEAHIQPVLAFIILGCSSLVFGSIPGAYVAFDFILPMLTFLVVFYLVKRLTKNETTSILASLFIIILPHFWRIPIPRLGILEFLSHYIDLVFGGAINGTGLLDFSRLLHPQLSFIFLAVSLLLLFISLERKSILFALLAGISFGLLFYVYLYFWTFFAAGALLLIIMKIVKKDFVIVRNTVITLATGFIVSIPFWISYINFLRIPQSQDILLRLGAVSSGFENFTLIVLVVSALFYFFYGKKDLTFYFIFAFLLGCALLLNSHFTIGRSLQVSRWIIRIIHPWLTLSIIVIIYRNAKAIGTKKNLRIAVGALSLILILYGFMVQSWVSVNNYQKYSMADGQIEAFEWLNLNTPADSVIVASGFYTNAFIPAYTHNNVFLPNGFYTLADNKESLERLFITYRVFGVPEAYLNSSFRKMEESFDYSGQHYIFHKMYKQNDWTIPDETMDGILSDYSGYETDPSEYLVRYRVDYIYEGTLEMQIPGEISLDDKYIDVVYMNDNVTIYEVNV